MLPSLSGGLDADRVGRISIESKPVAKGTDSDRLYSPLEARVLLAEDDGHARGIVEELLSELDCRIDSFADGGEVLAHLEGSPSPTCAVLDIRLPGADGLEIFRRLREEHPETAVILMTGYGNTDEAVEAMQGGAHYYFTKPVDFLLLRRIVEEILEKARLREKLEEARRSRGDHGILTRDPTMEAVLDRLQLVAGLPTTVLVQGETGTGKELVARALHRGSGREGHFVVVNCAAIPSDLLESELFGHERGAFTGAVQAKAGKLEGADGGTLFLDEVAELPTPLQAKILRVLEGHGVERVGGTRTRSVDVRFVAASHRNLQEAVREGSFREDLYHRLTPFTLELPPLRKRPDDIPLLAHHFLRELAEAYDRPVRALAPEALQALRAHDWPGNVRELRNVLEGAVIVCPGETLELAHLPPRPAWAEPRSDAPSTLEEMERRAIEDALRRYEGNRSAAARSLGITRNQIRYKIDKHGIE